MYDELGPETILKVYDAKTGMKGIICLDNTVRGPAKGGIRMTPTVNEQEVFELARAMTLKNALADLPFGGGKSGIIANSKKLTKEEKEGIVRAFARELGKVAPKHYVAAPDIAMGEQEMRWIADEIGGASITGKPSDLGGIPHELGSTGYGVYIAVKTLLELQGDNLRGKTVSIQGYGNVGSFAAEFMEEKGAILVSASDSTATIYDKKGINAKKLREWKESKKRIIDYPEHEQRPPDESLFIECDILVPAAQPEVITKNNYEKVRTKIIAEGANLPIDHDIEELLEKKGIHILPDILANAGGVISSWIEHIGGTHETIFKEIERIIKNNVTELEKNITEKNESIRQAVIDVAIKRIQEKKR